MAKTNKLSVKIKEKIKKVKALAERGDVGEKETAKKKLKELTETYGKLKDKEKSLKNRTFKLADFNDCKTIMVHCILDSNPEAQIEGSSNKKEIYVRLTDEQYANTVSKFNHYYPIYVQQKESFLIAFILKNNLGVFGGQDVGDNGEDVFQIMRLMNGLKSVPYDVMKALN
jgi:hypothetical protein